MQINFLAGGKGKRACASVWRAARGFRGCTLLWWSGKWSSASQAGLWCTRQRLTKGCRLCQPSSWRARRAGSQSGSPMLGLERMAWHGGPLGAPPPTSSLHCSCLEWFYKHFASGSIPVLIKHCESDPSKTQSGPELREGRSEKREAAERMEKGERVHSNSEREKRLKGREANLREEQMQSWRQVGGRFSDKTPGHGERRERPVITFSLREGGRERSSNYCCL